MNLKKPTILFHIFGWIAFIGFQFILFPKPEKLIGNRDAMPFIMDAIIINLFCIVFFYVNYYLLIPKLYFKRKFLFYLISVVFFAIISIFFIQFIHPEKNEKTTIETNEKGMPVFSENPLAPPNLNVHNRPEPLHDKYLIFGQFLLKFILTFLLSFGFRMYGRLQDAEEAKYKAELSFLKAQINPHFLFNTLNGIYVLAIKKSENTASAIMKLSSIMRYVISEGHHDYVSLEKEIKYITDYVDLQKMRLASNVVIDFEIKITDKEANIVPLILIPFIENAFKHGISTQESCAIKINLQEENNILQLFVKNNKYNHEIMEEEKSGIGVENTKRRLQLLYAEKHTLQVTETPKEYSILLKINLA